MEILSKLAISLKTNSVGNLYVLKISKTAKIDTKGFELSMFICTNNID